MVVIRIQEQVASRQEDAGQENGAGEMDVVVVFDHGVEYGAKVRDPFGEKVEREGELEWYFEEYLTFPFASNDVRKEHAAGSIREYGEALFGQVFADEGARRAYQETRQREGVYGLRFEIVGSAAFQRLHWEALYDAELGEPEGYLALSAVMVRRNVAQTRVPVERKTAKTINVLVVVARPRGRRDVAYRTISRPLVDLVERLELPVEVTLLRPGTYGALQKHLADVGRERGVGYYQVVHFDVHGALLSYEQFCRLGEGEKQESLGNAVVYKVKRPGGLPEIKAYEGKRAFLSLESEDGERSGLVEAREVANLLVQHQVPVAILNACQSAKYEGETDSSLGSRLVQAGVHTVVAMGYSITVSAAELLMKALYEELFKRKRLAEALSVARRELANDKERRAYYNQRIELEDWLLPIVYQNQEVGFETQAMEWGEEKAFLQGRADLYQGKKPEYGFVGRDVDILEIEKRLLLTRNVLLVRGMGGAGKTTLLQYLARWWQRTGLVRKVFYFGYDEKAWTRQQIMDTIAEALLGEEEWQRSFRLLPSVEAKLLRLGQMLKGQRHLIILDNLESITGSALAIRHTLSKKEQGWLQEMLAQLVGGETLVVLGSRGAEDWLAKGTFEQNRYDLGGLDDEAASMLAEKILEKHKATKYRGDKKLRELIKLLDGFPLALQVVLANLERQTPELVLEALQAGAVNLNVGDSKARTENILTCIDYTYSNLAEVAQQLLLCLAPFTSVVRIDMLSEYAERLKEQKALANVDFGQWDKVMQEAMHWGLLTPDERISSYAHIQPTLPYFLRNRLANKERKRAIERAFYTYYAWMSNGIDALMGSKDADERQIGEVAAQFEYENLMNALRFAVEEKVTIYTLYDVLDTFLSRKKEYRRGEELDVLVLSRFKEISTGELLGEVGEEYARILMLVANRQGNLRQYVKAKETYQKLSQLLKNGLFEENLRYIFQGGAYVNLGTVASEEKKWEEARRNYEEALKIYQKYEDFYFQGTIYHGLGRIAQEEMKWNEARRNYKEALRIFQKSGNRYEQAMMYGQLGVLESKESNWEKARSNYEKALQIFEEYGDRYIQGNTYINLGGVALGERKWEEARRNYEEALKIYQEYDDLYRQGTTYHSLGMLAQEESKRDEARRNYKEALKIYQEHRDRYNQGRLYHQLGIVAQEDRKWEEASENFILAWQIWMEYKDEYYTDMTILSLKRLWGECGDERVRERIAEGLGWTMEEARKVFEEDGEDENGGDGQGEG